MFKDISAILLCGGRSTRMGRDKGLIEWESEPLVVRLATLLQTLFEEVLVVTGKKPRYRELLDLPILEDEIKGLGPLGGLYSGLLASTNEYNLAAACDMLLIKPELIALLTGEIDDSWIIVPQVRGYLEPLPPCDRTVDQLREAEAAGSMRARPDEDRLRGAASRGRSRAFELLQPQRAGGFVAHRAPAMFLTLSELDSPIGNIKIPTMTPPDKSL